MNKQKNNMFLILKNFKPNTTRKSEFRIYTILRVINYSFSY